MKAILLRNPGESATLSYEEIETPTPRAGEVLVAVKSISVNPVDIKVRAIEDLLTMIYGEERPAILGWDIAGTVEAVGEGVASLSVGDAVFGMVNFMGAGKAYAEYVACPADHLATVPEGTSMQDAAATTLAALTALQALGHGNLKEGDRVFIHAGSGGVGHFAIQMAKAMGCHVTTTCSAKNRDFVLSLGADEHIDYREHAFETVASDMDFVLDGLGGETTAKSLQVVKDGGTIISLPSPEFVDGVAEEAERRSINCTFMMVQSSGTGMATLRDMLASGSMKPHVSATFPFDDMEGAHAAIASGRTVGKIVVKSEN